MSRSVTPGIEATAGSTSRGTATSTTSSGRLGPRRHDRARDPRARRGSTAHRWRSSSTSTSAERVGERRATGRARPPTRVGEVVGTVEGAIRDEHFGRARPPQVRRPSLRRCRRRRRTSTRRPARPSSASSAIATAAIDTEAVVGAKPVSVRTRLPTSTAWRNSRLRTARAVPSAFAASHASRTWPRISVSPSTAESSPAATANRWAHGAFVEVAVQVIGAAPRARGRRTRRGSRGRRSRRRGTARRPRTPRCGCRSTAARPR